MAVSINLMEIGNIWHHDEVVACNTYLSCIMASCDVTFCCQWHDHIDNKGCVFILPNCI